MTDSAPHDPTAIRIERTFRAPAQAVFEAWTNAEMLRRWYAPEADWDAPVAEVDLRIGGKVRVVMRSPAGEEFGGSGEYLEINPPTRLVFTWTWDRPDLGGATQLVEVEFTDNGDGTTTVIMTNRGLLDDQSKESHRAGWQGSFDNLDRVLVR
jgi:uncharacterized protein YndB with AHSA1/START domain